MFLCRGNTKRHFERHHGGAGHLLKVDGSPEAPIYENHAEYQQDPFNVVPKPKAKPKMELDSQDAEDLRTSLMEHTEGYADGWVAEDHVFKGESSAPSEAPTLKAPRRKLQSCLRSGSLLKRRLKNERPAKVDKRVHDRLLKNFYTWKVIYRRQWQQERKKAFWHANKSKMSRRGFNAMIDLEREAQSKVRRIEAEQVQNNIKMER
jgi:hypothetical protein